MGSERTPRHSSRLREKSKRKFRMPSREDILDDIEATPYTNLNRLKPRRIINNYMKEHNSYNNRIDLPDLSDDESLSDFIVDDVTPTSTRHKKRRKNIAEEKPCNNRRRQRIRALDYSDSEEESLENKKRQSSRIKQQPKKKFHKRDKKEELKKILEREPDLKDLIESDDAEDFVEDTDEEGGTSDGDEDGTTSEEEEEEQEVKSDEDCRQDTGENGVASDQNKFSVNDTISNRARKDQIGKSEPVNSEGEGQTDKSKNGRKNEDLKSEMNPSPKTEEDSSEDDSDIIRTSSGLRSKVHRRSQQSKALDSGESGDSEDEINISFAKRETKRKAKYLNSDDEDP